MNQRALHYYEFGPFRLNATERLLQRGSDPVPLTPKVFDTLLVLVENSGHVLEKNELMQQLWPDSFVEESSLTQNISLLRRALSDLNNEDNYIETIPKRGYRFVASVQERNEIRNGNAYEIEQVEIEKPDNTIHISSIPAIAQPRSFNRKYALALSAIVVAAALIAFGYWYRQRSRNGFAPRSVAVLPFKTIGTDSENDLLGLGMADALIIKLSRLDQMTVLPTSSVYRFTNRDRDPVAIGKELGVEGVLDGTVQRDGDWVRVTAQLIRLSDGKTVWSGKFDERYNSIFTLQDSISDQLSISLRPQVAGEKTKAHSTNNTEAYRNYLTGLYFWNRRTKDNLTKAISYLEQAVAQDPNFAEAHAILADCHYLRLTDEYADTAGSSSEESLDKARRSVARALELDDSLAEAHTVNAGLKLADRKFEDAGREFQRALELNPNYAVAHVRYAYFLYSSRLLDQALFHMRRAQQLDPVSSVTNGALAGMLYSARYYDESIIYSQKALELEPTTLAPHLNLGEAYLQKRMFNEAQAAFEKVRYTSPVYYRWEMAYSYALAGKRDEANRMLAEYEKQNPDGFRMHYNYALVYGAMGEKDKAFAELDLMNAGPFMLAGVKYDPQFDPLRGDPRFKEYMKKHGLE
jgi:DNA-binding winged helix-turn-helix (wHTH) protein/TolB-like protein/Flp pilus assembly protein TadD